MAWFKKYGMLPLNLFWLVLLATLSSSFIASNASAQDSNCSRRVIGERCYTIFRADAGKSGSTRDPKDTGYLERQVPSGYVVVNLEEVNESSNGGQFTVTNVTRGARSSLARQYSSQSTRINNFQQKIDVLYKDSESNIRAKLDVLKNELEQSNNAMNYFSSSESNIDIVGLRATSNYTCTSKDPFFGNCLDQQSGQF